MTPSGSDTFPRQQARTQRFTLGAPRNLAVSPDGTRVSFLRSSGAEDPVNALWVLDLSSGEERKVVDPRALLGAGLDDLPPEERARRERAREAAGGLTAYATDADHRVAVGAVAGQLVVADLVAGTSRLVQVPSAVVDPRPDPTGSSVAWTDGRALWTAPLHDPSAARALVSSEDPLVRWGVAEFVAAEEMDRFRGYWWSPSGDALLVARVDDTPVERWWIADPARPDSPPAEIRYPAAGTPNALVSAWLVQLDGTMVEVAWDREAWPYLGQAGWDEHGPFIVLQPRSQQAIEVRTVDAITGRTAVVYRDEDPVWVERAPGTPARLGDGRVVMCSDRSAARRLVVGDEAVTPEDLHVRAVVHVAAGEVMFTANRVDDATGIDVWRWWSGGVEPISQGGGTHTAAAGGRTLVLRSTSLDRDGARVTVLAPPGDGPEQAMTAEGEAAPLVRVIDSFAAAPLVRTAVEIRHVGRRRLATALLLPEDADPVAKLPVLLDPYGGPHAQRVVQARSAFSTSQWFADQGFAVVVIDGRGTPGRGPAWERSIHGDLASPVLEDQLDGLAALAELEPRLDLDRVAIRGWSFGGYLAALAALRRPDAIHAAIAGAPVTEWRLYDTFYTERYLGHPGEDPAPYDRSSLLPLAAELRVPLLLVHGLADDNVVAAHNLQLSSALLGAGRPHQVLPLTGVTHMASQEDVAEHLLLLQLDFLRTALHL
ncbi:MAG: prolyl oligopeptidase family serine peptidase [Actinomycetota bacterium]|nr:prolyl oligopeptidase family serine peptidase [Actinomycetota bacterium]